MEINLNFLTQPILATSDLKTCQIFKLHPPQVAEVADTPNPLKGPPFDTWESWVDRDA